MEARWYTRRSADAEPKGPFEARTIAEALAEGHLSSRTWVREEGSDDWMPLAAYGAFRAEDRPVPSGPPLIYAGFWSRLVANLLDACVFMLPVALFSAFSLYAAQWLTVAVNVAMPLYQVRMHARWGQTLGKMAARIRVVKVSGDPISSREAWLRSSVDIILHSAKALALLIVLTRVGATGWDPVDFMQLARAVELQPWWGPLASSALTFWMWSEVVVLLSNRKRRAPHDFIAGTVVVKVPR